MCVTLPYVSISFTVIRSSIWNPWNISWDTIVSNSVLLMLCTPNLYPSQCPCVCSLYAQLLPSEEPDFSSQVVSCSGVLSRNRAQGVGGEASRAGPATDLGLVSLRDCNLTSCRILLSRDLHVTTPKANLNVSSDYTDSKASEEWTTRPAHQ